MSQISGDSNDISNMWKDLKEVKNNLESKFTENIVEPDAPNSSASSILKGN